MTSKANKMAQWADVDCPTCGAIKNEGCFVLGRDTVMKNRYLPHKSREREPEHQPKERRNER